MNTSSSSAVRAIENDALIESSFRRLLASIEAEREKIRGTWQQIQQERDGTTSELERLRQDTEDWCYAEKGKIDAEWKRLDRLSERMNEMWPTSGEIIEINCSGTEFIVPKATLCGIEGSVLNQMFREEFIGEIPRDEQGRFLLDFNPICFGLIIEYLQNRRLRPDAPLPVVPQAHQQSMELLAQAWKLKPFLRENRINPVHGTSLHVVGNILQATHPGWQVITALYALPVANPSYFEVTVLGNPDSRGGLAVGICNHIPQGPETHSIRLAGSALYNSNNGIISDSLTEEDSVIKGVQFAEGTTFGIRNDCINHAIEWYHNRRLIGKTPFKANVVHKMRTLYPIFALYVPEQMIQVEFDVVPPSQEEYGGEYDALPPP